VSTPALDGTAGIGTSLDVGLGVSEAVFVVAQLTEFASFSRRVKLDAGTDVVTIKPVTGSICSMRFFLMGGPPSNLQFCDSERHSYSASVI
jgi:hypothetical protein